MDQTNEVLFTWLHLSDIHFGHGPASHRWDQQLVLRALKEDTARLQDRGLPKPDLVLLTGDIAYGGRETEYQGAAAWLEDVLGALGLRKRNILTVPGNHDVQRDADHSNRSVGRLVERLRKESEALDDALGDPSDRELLKARFKNYLEFARNLYRGVDDSDSWGDALYWHSQRTAILGLVIRFVGLNTALLSADDKDRQKLRVGKEQLAVGFLPDAVSTGELVVVLSHHPFSWLADDDEVSRWVTARAHIHLSGHVHEAESESLRKGSGGDIVKVVAGAVHGPGDSPRGHGYSLASVIANPDGRLCLRIWPRTWSPMNKDFRLSVDQIPEGAVFVDHELRLRLAAASSEQAPPPEESFSPSDRPSPTAPSASTLPRDPIAEPRVEQREFPPPRHRLRRPRTRDWPSDRRLSSSGHHRYRWPRKIGPCGSIPRIIHPATQVRLFGLA